MIHHGRYRVIRRPAVPVRENAEGLWYVERIRGVLAIMSREQVVRSTGVQPEELARPGWTCFWVESPERRGTSGGDR